MQRPGFKWRGDANTVIPSIESMVLFLCTRRPEGSIMMTRTAMMMMMCV